MKTSRTTNAIHNIQVLTNSCLRKIRRIRHYQQQSTMGKNKPDPSGGRNQEEALEVDRKHIEESIQMRHKANPYIESS
ncbi:unnamed protein product [Schistosoma margrebowiei]|uniref:Uncharacterized protein n=1 Tax=Schistosoma margrebowiei TaxID=48269 RepID=A0A183MZB6_9TREM|nr:unnamed protein product [Schistosoma margrebowiei]